MNLALGKRERISFPFSIAIFVLSVLWYFPFPHGLFIIVYDMYTSFSRKMR